MVSMNSTSRHQRQDRDGALLDTTDIVLNKEQQDVLDYLKTSKGHVFITGAAGSGKSVALTKYLDEVPGAIVLAPTGIAALLVGGSTIHSHFGIAPEPIYEKGKTARRIHKRAVQNLRYCRTIVIDEVSMVRADLLDAMDECLRFAKSNDKPFGGCRMIFVGDPFQLPPVVTDEEVDALAERYDGHTEGWFFHSEVWRDYPPKKFVLTECHRQKGDDTYIRLLNQIRTGNGDAVHELNELANHGAPPEGTPNLCTTNNLARTINDRELNKLDEETACWAEAEVSQYFNVQHAPVDEEIEFRIGARVMTMVNRDGYVNGSLGYVVEYDEITGFPRVEFDDGHVATIEPYTWERKEQGSGKVFATFEQLPIRHAWAITVHKSQGQSFDAALINLGRGAFAAGQTYVALSRVRSLKGVYLSRKLEPEDVFIDEKVKTFLDYMS